jgi:hypothetical protein
MASDELVEQTLDEINLANFFDMRSSELESNPLYSEIHIKPVTEDHCINMCEYVFDQTKKAHYAFEERDCTFAFVVFKLSNKSIPILSVKEQVIFFMFNSREAFPASRFIITLGKTDTNDPVIAIINKEKLTEEEIEKLTSKKTEDIKHH